MALALRVIHLKEQLCGPGVLLDDFIEHAVLEVDAHVPYLLTRVAAAEEHQVPFAQVAAFYGAALFQLPLRAAG